MVSALDHAIAWIEITDSNPNSDLARQLSAGLLGLGVPLSTHTTIFSMSREKIAIGNLARTLADGGGESDIFKVLTLLGQIGVLRIASSAEEPLCIIRPGAADFLLCRPVSGRKWRLSRFAFVRFELSHIYLESCHATVGALLSTAAVKAFAEIAADPRLDRWEDRDERSVMFSLLCAAGFLIAEIEQGHTIEDATPLAEWEFHDLLFHTRSRLGRTGYNIGGNYRFLGKAPPESALKPPPVGPSFPLPCSGPSLERLAQGNLLAVLEERRSERIHGAIPLSLEELGVFLFFSARVRNFAHTNVGEFTSRPYPSGGGSYELELYLAVDRCSGLGRGLYYYDALSHQLVLVSEATADFEALLFEAFVASANMCRPQVLIIVASRFRRVAWKYQGIAYATQLKNVGVLLGTFYSVATGMQLAGCALGLGNSSRFAKVAGSDFYAEGSIGEFMLGTKACLRL